MEGNIPLIGKRKRKNIYLDNNALRPRNRKQRLWKKYKNTKSSFDHNKYVQCKNELRSLTRYLRTKHETLIASNCKKHPKKFWSYVHSKLKSRVRIPALIKTDGTSVSGEKEKANALNDYFCSVFTDEDLSNIPTPSKTHYRSVLSEVTITREMVLKKLRDLKPNKSPGLDGWHPFYLRELAEELCTPLSILYSKSIPEGAVSSDWIESLITAIHKKGSKSCMGNYRPIRLISVICKILESLIRDQIINHMEVNDLFANEQHGFVPKRDCMTNLLIAMEKWTQVIEDGGNIDIIYTDFAKAFDSVPHKRLLTKIESLGIRGDILQWIKAFLVGRKQKVCVDGVHSSWNPVKSGIPQGSVLGPLLFVIYINDMPTKIKSLCLLFADDAKIYNENSNVLQEDMKKLSEWSYKWQLPFNTKKCKSLHIGGKNNHHLYTMNDQELDQVTEEKDLGIIIDENLKFHKHTAAAAKKANFILGLIKRSFASLDSNILPLLYKALVRPHLEYGNLIWGPHFKGDQIKLEKIQRRATKLVPGIKDLTYEERMRALRLPSLA